MAYSVINGAVGKSPLIDKLNQIPGEQIKNKVPKQMEQVVCGHNQTLYPTISASFDKCKKEIKEQLSNLRQESEVSNGEHSY
jgi:hypothetical protein